MGQDMRRDGGLASEKRHRVVEFEIHPEGRTAGQGEGLDVECKKERKKSRQTPVFWLK